jgi:hypothetical protein
MLAKWEMLPHFCCLVFGEHSSNRRKEARINEETRISARHCHILQIFTLTFIFKYFQKYSKPKFFSKLYKPKVITPVTAQKTEWKNFRIFLREKSKSFERLWSENESYSEGSMKHSEFPAKRQHQWIIIIETLLIAGCTGE